MNPKNQKQQERIRKQQAEQRERMMKESWLEQQKKPFPPLQNQQARKARSSAPTFAQMRRWTEAQYQSLRRQASLGQLTEAQFQEKAKALKLQDGLGYWWKIDAATGKWLRLVGNNWMPACFYRQGSLMRPNQSTSPSPISMPTHLDTADFEPEPKPLRGILVVLAGLLFAFLAGTLHLLAGALVAVAAVMIGIKVWRG